MSVITLWLLVLVQPMTLNFVEHRTALAVIVMIAKYVAISFGFFSIVLMSMKRIQYYSSVGVLVTNLRQFLMANKKHRMIYLKWQNRPVMRVPVVGPLQGTC